MDKTIAAVKKGLLSLASNQALYLFLAFLYAGIFNSNIFKWYREPIGLVHTYVLIPWSVALCVQRLQRADVRTLKSADTGLLTLMLAWVIVPFFLRFGLTFNNVTSWYGNMVAFFAVYAMTREQEAERRGRLLDGLCAGFALLSFVWGGALLYCAATVQGLGLELGGDAFGIQFGTLCAGYDYNTTGMNATCMALMCFVGMTRHKHPLLKLLHGVPAAMMALVVLLTQSRTSRYAVLIGLAAAAYGSVQGRMKHPRALVRHAAALLCAAMVLVGGHVGANKLLSAAVVHYNAGVPLALVPQAMAKETEDERIQEDFIAAWDGENAHVRTGVDASLSDRTTVWKNLFGLWRENPKHMIIGNGVGRTGSRIVEGTIHEWRGAVAVHNTYLQLIADFGLVGACILGAFFLMILKPVLRVFFARGDKRVPGGRALCALVLAILATGMLESQPLGAMTSMNMMLYYALAVLCEEGRSMCRA